jgi:hypothetical protein
MVLICLIIHHIVNYNRYSLYESFQFDFLVVVEVICVEPVREFVKYLRETLQQNPHVKCRELLVGNAENISGK